MTTEQIRQSRSAIATAIRDAGGEVLPNGKCRCPFHDDQSPSASVKLLDRGHWHYQCFPCNWGGDIYAVIQRRRQCTFPEAKDIAAGFVGELPAEPQRQKQVRIYPTPQAAAESYAEWKKCTVAQGWQWSADWWRFRLATPAGGKEFVEVTKSPAGWRIGGLKMPHCLYRIAEIPPTGPVSVHEGEKVCDASWSIGIPATTSGASTSAGKADWSPLAGRDVVIFPDNDPPYPPGHKLFGQPPPGIRYATEVAGILRSLTPPARCKIVRLPGLPPKGDLVEFLEARQ
jgi:hypothetical protein